MAISITVRNVPNETRDALAKRAARTGRSLQEYLVGELDRPPEAAEHILAARDADRR